MEVHEGDFGGDGGVGFVDWSAARVWRDGGVVIGGEDD